MKISMTKATEAQHRTYYGLGTKIDLTIFGTQSPTLLDKANDLISGYEDRLTINRTKSELMSVNDAAGQTPVAVSSSTFALTKLAVKTSLQHDGFNASIGPLVKLWDIGFSDAHVPDDASIKDHLKVIDPTDIVLDDQDQTIFLKKAGMELDLGGIAKGYIADRIRDLWRSAGVRAGMINLGGNVLIMGSSPKHLDGDWRIGVQNPFAERGDNIAAIQIEACSAVTSGIYERHLDVDGKSYHHILDSQTGYPRQNNLASVTVFSKDSVVGEIETTRLFFAGGPIPNWMETADNVYGAIFITKDKEIQIVGLPEGSFHLFNDDFTVL